MTGAVLNVQNSRGHLTVTRDYVGYGYLSKAAIPATQGIYDIWVSCVGTPRIFFDIPYNVADSSGQGYQQALGKAGVAMAGLRSGGTNAWIVTVIVNPGDSGSLPGLYIRVFGRVDLNWPSGSSRVPNLKIWTDAQKLCFDAGVRMLKLAGDTYETELILTNAVPGLYDPNNNCDAAITLPFSMANKSIAAQTRSTLSYPYNYGSYPPFDGSPEEIYQYHIITYNTLFAASGSQLQIKRCGTSDSFTEVPGGMGVVTTSKPAYSRLAVIDNTKFP